jgi:hypothetical protein
MQRSNDRCCYNLAKNICNLYTPVVRKTGPLTCMQLRVHTQIRLLLLLFPCPFNSHNPDLSCFVINYYQNAALDRRESLQTKHRIRFVLADRTRKIQYNIITREKTRRIAPRWLLCVRLKCSPFQHIFFPSRTGTIKIKCVTLSIN